MFSDAQRLFLLTCIFAIALFAASCFHNKAEQISSTRFVTKNPTAININDASESELEKLPGIGKELARRIIEHRDKYGKFRRAEYLILVKGISDKKFREINNLLKAE